MRGFVAAVGAVLLGAAMAIGSAGSAAAKENQEYTVGQWTGYSYVNDDSGQFTDCTVWASNNDGIQLGVSVLTDWSLRLYLYAKTWDLPQSQSYPVSYWVDRSGQFHGKVVTFGKSTVYIDADEDNDVFQDLKAGNELTVRTSADDYVFNLAGSRAALSQLVDCVDRHAKASATNTNPFGPGSGDQGGSPQQQQQTNQQQDSQQQGNQQQGNQGNGSASAPMNDFSMSVNDVQKFLVEVTGAKPSMIKVKSRTDKAGALYYDFTTPLGGGQFWQEKPGSTALEDMAANYVAGYRKECKGDFETSPAKPVQSKNGELAAGTAACSSSPYQNDGPEVLSYSMAEDQNQGMISVYVTYTGGNAAKAKSDSLGRLIERRYEDVLQQD